MPKFFSQIWSLAKKTAIDIRDDFRLVSGCTVVIPLSFIVTIVNSSAGKDQPKIL